MRGEKSFDEVLDIAQQGSPPHARGKVNRFCNSCFRPGITPACAGKRKHIVIAPPIRRDHPRMRGEKTVIVALP